MTYIVHMRLLYFFLKIIKKYGKIVKVNGKLKRREKYVR